MLKFLMTNKFVTRIVNNSCNKYICNKKFGHILKPNLQDLNSCHFIFRFMLYQTAIAECNKIVAKIDYQVLYYYQYCLEKNLFRVYNINFIYMISYCMPYL